MKSLLHNQLAAAGQMASTLRQLPGAPLRLPHPLAEHQPFVDRVYRRSQPKPAVQPLRLKNGNSSLARP